jgi:hypothetical protein
MPPLINMTDSHHGHLTVLGLGPSVRSPNGDLRRMWHCRCACGNEVNVRRMDLVSGATGSCGCRRGFYARKLTVAKVAEIRRRIRAGESQRALGRHFGVSCSMIGQIARGACWKQAAMAVVVIHRVLRAVDPACRIPPPGWTVEWDRYEEDTALWELTANRKAA